MCCYFKCIYIDLLQVSTLKELNMKKVLISTLAVALGLAMASFSGPKADVKYTADPSATTVAWNAKKVTGEHSGFVKLAKGTLVSDGKNYTSGVFEIDMNSMTNTDMQGEYMEKLLGHLKSDDFFSVAKFPTAKLEASSFTLKSGNDYEVKGKLTIKGITKDITFPATITSKDGVVNATATIKVDRTIYDIRYGSGKFFENLGDKAIYDDFTLVVKLVAKK